MYSLSTNAFKGITFDRYCMSMERVTHVQPKYVTAKSSGITYHIREIWWSLTINNVFEVYHNRWN